MIKILLIIFGIVWSVVFIVIAWRRISQIKTVKAEEEKMEKKRSSVLWVVLIVIVGVIFVERNSIRSWQITATCGNEGTEDNIKKLQEALRLNPNNKRASSLLTESISNYNKERARRLWEEGMSLWDQRKFYSALVKLGSACDLDPSNDYYQREFKRFYNWYSKFERECTIEEFRRALSR